MTGPARTVVGAIDLGAESGRVASVAFDGERLELEIAHRFTHTPRDVQGVLRWNMDTLEGGIQQGLAALAEGETKVASVGVDAWGVDYGLIGASGELVDEPTCYRDPRQVIAYERARDIVGSQRLYHATGVQLHPINTVFALMSDAQTMPQRLDRAANLLMLPDVFHHLLSGSRVTEYSAVSTTGCYDMASAAWATDLLDELGVPIHFLPEVVQPGTDVGRLLPVFATSRLATARVIMPPGHDTASAVVGTPLAHPNGLYISSGTWSLVGLEVPRPVISEETQAKNITNEGGYGGTIRLLRNVAGLWLLQACRRVWADEGRTYSYPELVSMAVQADALRSIVNPDAPEFLDGRDAPARIQAYCASTGTTVPETPGEIVRCALDSLALSYRGVLDDLRAVTGLTVPSINIVGGGSNNALLSQLTADATGLPVYCGPVEATALGNAATQLVALGEMADLGDIRRVIATTTDMTSYVPNTRAERWDDAYAHFTHLLQRDRNRHDVARNS
jgi:rhamnulokinase